MKYCSKCGAEIHDEAVFCVHCGCAVEGAQMPNQNLSQTQPNSQSHENAKPYHIAIKILLILSCVLDGIFLIPLCWMIPMTISAFKAMNENRPFGTGFSVCTILFVNTIAGILMLCCKYDN